MPFARAADDDDASDTSSLVSTVIGEHMPLISRDELFGGAWSGHESAAHGELERRARPGPKRTRRVVSLLAFMIAATAAAAIVVLLAGRAPAAAGTRRGSLESARTAAPGRDVATDAARPAVGAAPVGADDDAADGVPVADDISTDDARPSVDDAPIGADDDAAAQNRLLRGSEA